MSHFLSLSFFYTHTQAAMTQALAAKEANLKGLQQHVAQALDAMSGPPAGFTVVKLTAAAADESVDAIAGAGGATKEGAVVSEGGVHAGVRQHSTLTQGSAVQKAGGRNGEEEQGGADSNCLQIVLHSAALSAQPQPQFGQQHTGTPQLLLLQLSAAGVEQPFRKIVACRGVAAHTGAGGLLCTRLCAFCFALKSDLSVVLLFVLFCCVKSSHTPHHTQRQLEAQTAVGPVCC